MQLPLARIVLASFAPRFAPGPRRPWIAEPTWAVLQQLLEARRTRFATVRRCRRSLLRLVFSAWHRDRQDHRSHACDYHQQCALFDYRVAFAMWNERYFGAFARACLPGGLPGLASGADGEDLKRGRIWRFGALLVFGSRTQKARANDWSLGLSWKVQAFLPPSHLASRSLWESTEFGHRVKIDSLDDHSLSSSRRERPCPFEVPSVADVQAALEPLTGTAQDRIWQPFGLPARGLLQAEGDHFCNHLP